MKSLHIFLITVLALSILIIFGENINSNHLALAILTTIYVGAILSGLQLSKGK